MKWREGQDREKAGPGLSRDGAREQKKCLGDNLT